ncbi:hypothetical protein HK105_207446 [Polyrhizophydium stewartii]|uniref:MORN repeat-containing protein 3 n=1 Tax=Polyrhizophydium stewartii TaxID=2732419 RepID=A0ABR4N0P5_9FUNG|nr:hypothetical protein HK105_005257 [Polyrhizophydium stewartii]
MEKSKLRIARHADIAKTPRWRVKDKLSQKMGPHATVYLINGDRYIGDWKDNKRHGKGMHFYCKSGNVYEGEWENDMRHGYGTLSVPVADAGASAPAAAGSTSPSRRHGGGKRAEQRHHGHSDTSGAAAGDSDDDSIAGGHTDVGDDASTIFGGGGGGGGRHASASDSHDRDDASAVPLRKVYAGAWAADKRHGIGTYFYHDGAVYEGEWQNDMKEGWGRMMYPDGSVYEGEWHHENRHGQGILLLANGDRYEGMWLVNEKEGPGRFVYRTKRQIYEGEWTHGMPKCGTLRDLPPLPGQREKLYPIPPLTLNNPTAILDAQRQLIYDERMQRMMGGDSDSGEH